MNEEQQDFAAKLTLIEWEAKLALEELPPGVLRDRVQHIATIARLLSLQLTRGELAARSSDPPTENLLRRR